MLHACYVDAREIEDDTHNELGGDHIDLKRCVEVLSLRDDVTSVRRSGMRRLCGVRRACSNPQRCLLASAPLSHSLLQGQPPAFCGKQFLDCFEYVAINDNEIPIQGVIT